MMTNVSFTYRENMFHLPFDITLRYALKHLLEKNTYLLTYL